MTDYSQLTHAELVERLHIVESGQAARDRDALIHDLEVHQTELELQNLQLRETQVLLEESRARYADLYDFAPVAYCTFDSNGCIVEINLTGANLLGMDRSSLLGKPFLLFVASPDRPAFLKHLKDCLDKTSRGATDLTLTLKTRKSLVVQLASNYALDTFRNVVSCRAALTDISERKQGEAALRLAVRMRQDFLAVVSHDLKNPLSSILLGTQGLLRLIADSDRESSTSRHLLALMQRSATRMNRLIEDLLDLSSMDAGHLSMRRQTHDAAELAGAAIELTHPMALKKAIRVALTTEGAPLTAYCDRDRIIQVLLNLVGNAIKFTAEGGSIDVDARPHGDGVLVAVRDSGSGIATEQLARVFDPYWQADKSIGKGTGLGLSIARGIIEFHGGKLWAESEVGRGSTFFFTLPATAPVDERAEKAAPQESCVLGARRPAASTASAKQTPVSSLILVVDNDEDTRDSLAGVLRAEGYEIATASDGAAALVYLGQVKQKPFVILLDIDMPVMNGTEFLGHRAQDVALAAIPVVIISGQATALSADPMWGYDDFIQKPISISTLLHKVQQVAQLRSVPAPR